MMAKGLSGWKGLQLHIPTMVKPLLHIIVWRTTLQITGAKARRTLRNTPPLTTMGSQGRDQAKVRAQDRPPKDTGEGTAADKVGLEFRGKDRLDSIISPPPAALECERIRLTQTSHWT